VTPTTEQENLSDPNPHVRARAALGVLEAGPRLREAVELAAEVAQLREAVAAMKAGRAG